MRWPTNWDCMGQADLADRLIADVDRARSGGAGADPLADTGFKLLLGVCTDLGRRPVLLVDNLDFIFQRIDKAGRKLKDPHAPAYWALREILSTTTAPIVIGGSVRLSEPFTDYDKAFYDFFIPKRLGKLDLKGSAPGAGAPGRCAGRARSQGSAARPPWPR